MQLGQLWRDLRILDFFYYLVKYDGHVIEFERADAVAIVFIVVPWMVCFISGLLQIEMDGLIQGHRGFETLVWIVGLEVCASDQLLLDGECFSF